MLPPGIVEGKVGSLSGAVSVDPSGAAGWSMALTPVPGVGGMTPGLGISYDGAGYGGLGLGFSLDAGGTISRCRSTLAQDGAHGPITWTQADPICWNGSRLEAVKGVHGGAGTEYRVPLDRNTRVVGLGATTSPYSGFAVYTPDGRVTLYGVLQPHQWTLEAMQWAQVDGERIPFAWHIARVRDEVTGNELRYRYTGEAVAQDGEITPRGHALSAIEYGINEKAGAAEPTRQVVFDYAPVQTLLGEAKPWEPVSAWVHQGYVAGQSYTRSTVLTRVTMQVRAQEQWDEVRHYRLGYEPVPDVYTKQLSTPDRLRLRALQECAPNATSAGATCLWPTLFEWSGLTEQAGGAVNPMVPMPGYAWDGASFYPLPPADQLQDTVYRRPSPGMEVKADLDGDGDIDMLVMPERMNTEVVPLQFWEYWQTDPNVHGAVATNVPAWSATPWTNRVGTVVPEAGSIHVLVDMNQSAPRAPEAVQHGHRRDDQSTATPGAWALNYDGTGGTDVLVGEPVTELAGATMDPPYGLGEATTIDRLYAQGSACENQGAMYQSTLDACQGELQRSEADYTAHPGFMKGLKVLRLARGATGGATGGSGGAVQFEQTSLGYRDGRPILWAQVLDMNGDALTDVMFCKADADYAAAAGKPLPMFYGPGMDPVNWVSGTLHYAMNAPGTGIDLSGGGVPVTTPGAAGEPVPCHAKDSYLVLDLDGTGTESLLHRTHGHVRQLQIAGIAPSVPDGVLEDPYPRDPDNAALDGYWPKLLKRVWADMPLGETYYHAFSWHPDTGVRERPTTLPYEQFMRWQQRGGNSTRRYSTHRAGEAADEDGGPNVGQWQGAITDWADPNDVMVGFGPSDLRLGDFNGDGLTDVLAVDQQACYVLQQGASPGDAPTPLNEGCSFRSVLEWGGDLVEQTYEKLAVFVYLNRGDGSFALGGSTRLWDTDLESDQAPDPGEMVVDGKVLKAVLEHLYWGVDLDPSLDLDGQQIDALHREAWTRATSATRRWRMEFGNSVIGDPNGDGLADLGYIKALFAPDGGWQGDSLSGTYTLEPVWRLSRHGGDLAEVDTPMGLDLKQLVPASVPTGWPGWQRDLVNRPTLWKDADDAAATVGPYEQQAYGLGVRLMQLDVNRDGQPELAFYDHVRGQYKLATPTAMSEPQPHLLTAVTDGLGARTELDYAPQWTLTTPSTPWTQDDVFVPYPLVRRPSAAAAVARLRSDTGQDDGDAPRYLTTQYLYGKTTADVRRGISLGIERSYSKQSVQTPSGPVNRMRLARYDVTPAYDEAFKAYPLAGTLRSETMMISGGPDDAVRISHGGQRHSAHAGKVGPTWYTRLDSSTASTFEIGADVPATAAGTLFECLADAYDGAGECTLGPQLSHQALNTSTTTIGYDDDGYGLVKFELVEAAGNTTLTERKYQHTDPADVLGKRYLLGLPTTEWVANEPTPGAGYTVRTVAHAYDGQGRLQQTTVEPQQAKYRHAQHYTYDAFGNLATHTLVADGQPASTTSYQYGASGAYPVSQSNALGHTTTTQWNEGCGVPECVTNALGHTQVSTLDPFCRTRGSQLFHGDTPLTRKTTIAFEEWQPDAVEGYPDREVLVTTAVEGGAKSYALANRVGQAQVAQSQGFGFEVYTQTTYDPLGRVLAVSLPTRVGEQPSGWTTTGYDSQGRVTLLTKPDGTQQATAYGRDPDPEKSQHYVATVTNEIGHSGSSTVNALGQVIHVDPPADPALPDVDLSMCYTYGAFGTLVEAAPCTATAAKSPTTLVYDDYGRLLQSHDGQAGVRTTRYDVLGRVDETEDALGQITKTRYDVLGRMIERIEAYGTPQAKSATWTYDAIAPGVLTEATNADGTVTESPLLDEHLRPAGSTTTVHGRTYTQRLSYDAWGRIASQSYPTLSLLAPVQTWNQYNALDQIVGLSVQQQTVWQPIAADVWGHLTEQRYGSETAPTVIATAAYDPLTGRLHEATVAQRTWHDADLFSDTPIERYTYDWYDHGLIRSRVQPSLTQPGQEQVDRFAYTPRGELQGWTTIGANQGVRHHTMAYDGFGNIVQSPNGSYAYEQEKLAQIKGPLGQIDYTYDGNGQVLTRTHAGGQTALTYDALNRVSGIDAPGSNQAVTYTADGTKVHVLDKASGRETVYLGAYQEERGGALGKTIVGRYALGPLHLTRTWQPDLSYTDQRSYTPPADHLGSTTLVTTEQGNVRDRRAYDTWGNEREPGDWNTFKAAPKDEVTLPITGYTGHHERKQFGATAAGISGLIDMHTRYYDP
ncbi:hypothetical protein, partial [Chiayiivirga flava]|nr:YD repeat-containing protein [Chiayiivirga flava]